ncbi:MAG: nucleotidyltransferase family protein [Clostridia bacterium]|nr:nucleotidyltransferase family protein [Clostridia bacterium]
MKICGIICEYNPFHNGHLYQLCEAKRLSGADALVCLMSGNFVQRGEAAVADKYIRAKHAVLAGADVVLELPTIFATSNAELFAKGAVKLLSSIPALNTLCFGAETADKAAFLQAAKIMNDEPQEVSRKLKEFLRQGMSYAKARALAFDGWIPETIVNSPNNILGVEYTRALLSFGSSVKILPIERVGGGYSDSSLQESFSSATAIRSAMQENREYASQVPDFVLKDMPKQIENCLETLEKYALIERSAEEISKICDCAEGLENALKKAAKEKESLTEILTSARYTSSRIRRIALQNLLKIDEDLIRESLHSPLYLRVLAAKKERSDVLSALSESSSPLMVRAHDENVLSGVAKECFQVDRFAEKVYGLLYPETTEKSVFQ